MVKKRRSAKQRANDLRLKAKAKAGTLFKRRRSAKKRVVRGKKTRAGRPRKSRVSPSKTRRSRGGSASDVNKSLLLDDIGRLGISTANKRKIVSSISKRLKI